MDYLGGIKTLAERSTLFAGRDLRIVMIANPVAGGFTIKKRAAQNRQYLERALKAVEGKPILVRSASAVLYETKSAEHAGVLAREVFSAAIADEEPDALYLVIIAGGDGTSLDVQTEYAQTCVLRKETRLSEKVCLLRLPFGTGNDGSDGRTLDESLALLTDQAHFEKQCAVRVYPAQGRENAQWFAFNIASVGVDAFITDMTNRMKRFFPGDFYKVCVDIACLFYAMYYTIGKMTVVMTKRDGIHVLNQSGRFLLMLMGASGYRTYGSNQKILPDENNVCGVREMSLGRKLSLRSGFKSGKHAQYPETILCKAEKMVIYYGERILLQLDGEANLLYPADFPITMELTDPFILVIKPDA
ncbi:MAG TPA: diacylglycerol kinase family protein [Treponemataceae bacterium]|nr:diacylglycerol kinase family protein [Treponemataceae bacterium]